MSVALRVVSDVHVELRTSASAAKWAAHVQPSEGCVALVLAGDIGTALNRSGGPNGQLEATLHTLGRAWPLVVYVPGNHENWGTARTSLDATKRYLSDIDGLLDEMCARAGPNVVLLQKRCLDLPGTDTTLVGCTLWSAVSPAARMQMNDASSIFEDTRLAHTAHVKWLDGALRAVRTAGRRAVVVTHHLPSFACIPPKYQHPQHDELNTGYATALDKTHPHFFDHASPVVGWIHGHTHECRDVRVGVAGVRVVSNPTGYPGERRETCDTHTPFVF